MSSSVNPVSSPAAAEQEASPQQTTSTKNDELTDKTAFLKLLVAQIRNQDPLNPADGVEFLSQLVQFSQVEQLIEIRTAAEQIRDAVAPQPEGTTETDTQTAKTAA